MSIWWFSSKAPHSTFKGLIICWTAYVKDILHSSCIPSTNVCFSPHNSKSFRLCRYRCHFKALVPGKDFRSCILWCLVFGTVDAAALVIYVIYIMSSTIFSKYGCLFIFQLYSLTEIPELQHVTNLSCLYLFGLAGSLTGTRSRSFESVQKADNETKDMRTVSSRLIPTCLTDIKDIYFNQFIWMRTELVFIPNSNYSKIYTARKSHWNKTFMTII